MSAPENPRSAARLLVAQILYQLEVRPGDPTEALSDLVAMTHAHETVAEYAKGLLDEAWSRREEIDRLVAEHLGENWTLARLGKVEKSVLRMATAELLGRPDVPARVVLDEALELGRDFLDDPGIRFLNGVLDPLARTIREGALSA